MKKPILAIVILMVANLSNAFAEKGKEVNPAVTASFYKDFGTVKTVSWEMQKDYDKATFSLDDQVLYAYYREDGELLAVVRNILSSQLPINLMTMLKVNYQDYWISNLFEIASDGNTHYYVTLENAEGTLVLESDEYDQWSVYNKSRKTVM